MIANEETTVERFGLTLLLERRQLCVVAVVLLLQIRDAQTFCSNPVHYRVSLNLRPPVC